MMEKSGVLEDVKTKKKKSKKVERKKQEPRIYDEISCIVGRDKKDWLSEHICIPFV